MLEPTVCQIEWKTSVEPVKWTPARCSLARTRLITPGGRPASSRSFIVQYAEYAAVEAGFQMTTSPITAGLVDRLAPIAVKLNGEIANTKPSSGRYSILFQTPGEE